MNILFYVEPLIEKCDPYWKTGWLTYCCSNLISTLDKAECSYNYAIAVNEGLSSAEVKFEAHKVVFSQSELLKPFDGEYLQASIAWYKGSYSKEQLDYYVDLMRQKLGGFSPDIIITFSPAPFFRAAFPDALLLHHEYSIFSRAPYPEAWFLDPCGMSEGSFLNAFGAQCQPELDATQKAMVARFKKRSAEVLEAANPFKNIIRAERERFRHLVLLPLQDSAYYSFDGIVPFSSQYSYLVHVLENIPADIGVVVTMHPDYPVLKDSALKFLKGKYPNFIFHPEFSFYQAASQYLVKNVDAVITVSSTVGIQTMFFGVKLVTLGNTFSYIADSTSLADLPGCLDNWQGKDNDRLLYWIITRFAILKEDLHNPELLSSFLERSLRYFRDKREIGYDFYQELRPAEEIFQSLLTHLDQNAPKLPELSTKSRSVFAQMYFDIGEGYREVHSIKKRLNLSEVNELSYGCISTNIIRSVRFDPLKEHGVVEIVAAKANTPTGTVALDIKGSNAAVRKGNRFYFDCDDPQIRLEFSSGPTQATEVCLSVRYLHRGDDAFREIIGEKKGLLEELSLQSQQQLNERDERIRERDRLLEERGHHLRNLEQWLKEREELLSRSNDLLNNVKAELVSQSNIAGELEKERAEQGRLLHRTNDELKQRDAAIEERDAVIAALKVDLTDLDARLAQLAEELQCAGELHRELEKRLDWKRAEIVSRDDRVKQIRFQIQQVGEQRVELERKLRQKTVELADRDERLRQVADEIAREAKVIEEHLRRKDQELAEVTAAREAEKHNHEQERARLSEELESLRHAFEERLRDREQRIEDLLQSLSWKVTAPLRSMYDLVRGRR